jgi:hypothetical protein
MRRADKPELRIAILPWLVILTVILALSLVWEYHDRLVAVTERPQAPSAREVQAKAVTPPLFMVPLTDSFPARAAEEGEWKDCPDGYEYRTGAWQVLVNADGTIGHVRRQGETLVRRIFLHGSYVAQDTPHDARFFQNASGSDASLRLRLNGTDSHLHKSGDLSNKHFPQAATYVENLLLQPDGLICDMEVTLTVTLATHCGIFVSLAELPLDPLAGRGFRLVDTQERQRLAVIPRCYDRESDIRRIGLRQFCAVMQGGWLTLAADSASVISLSDERSYGGEDIRFDIGTALPWRPEPVVYPPGTVFRWRWKLKFIPFPENVHGTKDSTPAPASDTETPAKLPAPKSSSASDS